jgi:hypothetical protein
VGALPWVRQGPCRPCCSVCVRVRRSALVRGCVHACTRARVGGVCECVCARTLRTRVRARKAGSESESEPRESEGARAPAAAAAAAPAAAAKRDREGPEDCGEMGERSKEGNRDSSKFDRTATASQLRQLADRIEELHARRCIPHASASPVSSARSTLRAGAMLLTHTAARSSRSGPEAASRCAVLCRPVRSRYRYRNVAHQSPQTGSTPRASDTAHGHTTRNVRLTLESIV